MRKFFVIFLLIIVTSALYSADINEMKDFIKENNLSFKVKNNEALKTEIDKLCGTYLPLDWEENTEFHYIQSKKDLPSSYDWRDFNGVTPVKNQGGCGSCWAFAAVGALESQIAIKDNFIEDLSEQEMVSCNIMGYDCGGGQMDASQHFVDYGAALEEDFTYTAYELPCPDEIEHPYKLDDWSYVANNVEQIKNAIYEYGPVFTTVRVTDYFQAYDSGIFDYNAVGSNNHAVLLVGWNDNGGNGYWIMKNSWGGYWGENGYMKIAYGVSGIGASTGFHIYSGLQPEIYYQNSEVVNDDNSNYEIEAGETIEFKVKLKAHALYSFSDLNGIISFVGDKQEYASILQNNSEFPDAAPRDYIENTIPFKFVVNGDAPLGTHFVFNLSLDGYCEDQREEFHQDYEIDLAIKSETVIIDLSRRKLYGSGLQNAVYEAGYSADIRYDLDEINKYSAAFITMGIYGNKNYLTDEVWNPIKEYMDNGGSVYLEGGDLWYYDPVNGHCISEHLDYFGVQGLNSGTDLTGSITGSEFGLAEGLSFEYLDENLYNKYIDNIVPVNGGAALLNQNENIKAVSKFTDNYKAIGSSLLFEGLFSEDFSQVTSLAEKYLEFLLAPTAIEEETNKIPFKIYSNFPNPFNPVTTIKYSVDTPSEIFIGIYNVSGRLVKKIDNGFKESGHYSYTWNGVSDKNETVSSGIYFVKMKSGNKNASLKMLLLK